MDELYSEMTNDATDSLVSQSTHSSLEPPKSPQKDQDNVLINIEPGEYSDVESSSSQSIPSASQV